MADRDAVAVEWWACRATEVGGVVRKRRHRVREVYGGRVAAAMVAAGGDIAEWSESGGLAANRPVPTE